MQRIGKYGRMVKGQQETELGCYLLSMSDEMEEGR